MLSEIKSFIKGEKAKPNFRNRYWFINMIRFYTMKAFTTKNRDENLWVFGCWLGERFDDNSRYLFEYVNNNHKEIRAVWLTSNPDIEKRVKDMGYEVYISNSIKGEQIQKKAGVVFCTTGFDDFGYQPKVYGAIVCSMWHGVAIKHHYFAGVSKMTLAHYKNLIQMKIFDWTYRDITTTSSEASTDFFKESFALSNKTMALTGFPRDDVFEMEFDKAEILGNSQYDKSKIILYMPTYRNYEDNTIVDTINGLNHNKNFLRMLEDENAYFLLKKHFLTKLDSSQLDHRIVVLDNNKVSSTQELLSIADVLITDYSSCIFDFSITGRQSLLYVPDFDIYDKNVGVLDRWREMYKECGIHTIDELCHMTINAIKGKCDIAKKTTLFVKDVYIDKRIRGQCYSENVYEYVKKYQKRRKLRR